MIEPTYFLACPIFEDGGFRGRLRGIPEGRGEDCVDLEFLLDELSKVGVVFEDASLFFSPSHLLADIFFLLSSHRSRARRIGRISLLRRLDRNIRIFTSIFYIARLLL